eukprot:2925367-Pyramimonas_sp.AAC.1
MYWTTLGRQSRNEKEGYAYTKYDVRTWGMKAMKRQMKGPRSRQPGGEITCRSRAQTYRQGRVEHVHT